LFQLRFGDELHFCEVMLKDVADSKRVNTRIRDERKQKGEIEVQNFVYLKELKVKTLFFLGRFYFK